MKNAVKKIVASMICGTLLVGSAAGCADTSWSVKKDDETLSVGTYIYYMTEAYAEAKDKTGKSGNAVLSETIDDKTGDEWIRERAKELCIEQLTLDKLCQDNNITVTDDEVDSTYNDKSLFYGYYSYSDMWVMSKQSYENMGISENSYKNAIIKTALQKDKLFAKLYDEGGTQEVADEELEKYFTENYVSYKYLSTDLNTTDESGNSTTMTDEEKEVVKEQYERYVKLITDGKTLDDVAEQYNKDYPSEESSTDETSTEDTSSTEESSTAETTSDEASSAESSTEAASSTASEESTESSDTTATNPIQSSLEDLNSEYFVFGDEVKEKLKEMKEGEAAYVETASAYYFLYKMPIADEISDALDKNSTTSYRSTILHSVKDDDFDKYIDEQAKKLDYEFNDAAYNKYTPSRVIPDSDNSTEESSEEASTESSTESSASSEASTESTTESSASSEATTESTTESSASSEASAESTTESSVSSEASAESSTESKAESSTQESSAQG